MLSAQCHACRIAIQMKESQEWIQEAQSSFNLGLCSGSIRQCKEEPLELMPTPVCVRAELSLAYAWSWAPPHLRIPRTCPTPIPLPGPDSRPAPPVPAPKSKSVPRGRSLTIFGVALMTLISTERNSEQVSWAGSFSAPCGEPK